MTVQLTAPALVPGATGRAVRSLVALGDSTTVGIGDRVPGGWRGFAPLLADGLGAELHNLSFQGARMRCVRDQQLPRALAQRPDAAVLVVGMNDTLRSDFDAEAIKADLDEVVGRLTAAGTTVLTARFHDHARVFRIPGPLARALRSRIAEVNDLTDEVVGRHRIGCLDLDALPGAYDLPTWSVDRLHPSELGHRMLARGFGELLEAAGCRVPEPVSMTCAGGVRITPLHHVGWLLFKGLPWLWRRSSDLLPYAAQIIWRDIRSRR
ncbi:SGNH/GDSL hydrolase family protein [Crossiella cryophila]|uniref:Lysophospholipase L1-like esterase n=1 Tax=Crossiella cryophila TaxID=43355 RepID=A0A7W7CGT1_9PSEU|nr:SGNH/GDSL hydrolase family protein [Crossiella cryophila]MBB4680909.1 lysophospholipase L1-like esterase [Crossiella cryophila]